MLPVWRDPWGRWTALSTLLHSEEHEQDTMRYHLASGPFRDRVTDFLKSATHGYTFSSLGWIYGGAWRQTHNSSDFPATSLWLAKSRPTIIYRACFPATSYDCRANGPLRGLRFYLMVTGVTVRPTAVRILRRGTIPLMMDLVHTCAAFPYPPFRDAPHGKSINGLASPQLRTY